MKSLFKQSFVPIITFLISIILGLIFKDYFLGTLTLIVSFLNAYYLALGKWYNYIYGIITSLMFAIVSAFNGLYGWAILSIIFYVPIQIKGLVNWRNHNQDSNVLIRKFNVKNSILICTSISVFSLIFGYLLSLIPSQQLSFLDASSQVVNVAGIILSVLRFKESWYIWLINNVLDLIIWGINVYKLSQNGAMMLITSLMYLVMNIIGIITWKKIENEQQINDKEVSI